MDLEKEGYRVHRLIRMVFGILIWNIGGYIMYPSIINSADMDPLLFFDRKRRNTN